MRTFRTTTLLGALSITTVVAALTACSSDSSSESSGYDGEIGATDLSEVCPSTVSIQTDWFPEAEHGQLYELLGPDPDIDSDGKKVTAPLFDGDNGYTGVDVQILAGGPAIGNQAVTSQLYQNPSIYLGLVDSDQSVQQSGEMPTTGVLSTFEKAAAAIMWDPDTYPEVKTIADLKDAGADVLYFQGATYMDYLTGAGILSESQVDSSFDGSPSSFVAAGGKKAQEAFVTSNVYSYEHQVDGWMKPVNYQLIHDAGYTAYKSVVATKSGDLEDKSECLEQLVPVMQRGIVDYMASPEETNQLIVDINDAYNGGWVYNTDIAANAAEQFSALDLVKNGPDGTIGSFEDSRLQTVIDQTSPIFAGQGLTVKEDLSPVDIATNEFLDPAVSLAD